MKRQHLLATLALAAVMGCGADNRASIEITGRALQGDPKVCEFATGGKFVLGSGGIVGTYDVALAGSRPEFDIALYVQNNMVDPNTIAPGSTTQSMDWSVEAVRVRVNPKEYVDRYKPSPGLAAISGESILPMATSSIVKPSGGEAVFYTNLISDGLLAALQAGAGAGGTVVLGITLQGRTNDGARRDSSEWPLPLAVCSGCLLDPTVGTPPGTPPPGCPTGTSAIHCLGQVFTCQ